MNIVAEFFAQYAKRGHVFLEPGLEVICRNGMQAWIDQISKRIRGKQLNHVMYWRLNGAYIDPKTKHPMDIVAIPSAGIDERENHENN